MPIVPGKLVRGQIEVSKDVTPYYGFHVRLAGIRVRTTRSGENRLTTESTL